MVSITTRVACVQTFTASSKTGVSSARVADLLLVCFCFLEWTLFKVFSVFCINYVIWRPYQSRTPTPTTTTTTTKNPWLPCLMVYMTKSKAGKAGTGLACVTDGNTDLVKSVCETVSKSLFWAPTCVPGFEYALWLACLKCYCKFAIEGKSRNPFPVIRWVRWGARTRISVLLRRRY